MARGATGVAARERLQQGNFLLPSPQEIDGARTRRGGWTAMQLAEWGVKWPPPLGWRAELEQRWRELPADRAAEAAERYAAKVAAAEAAEKERKTDGSPDWLTPTNIAWAAKIVAFLANQEVLAQRLDPDEHGWALWVARWAVGLAREKSAALSSGAD